MDLMHNDEDNNKNSTISDEYMLGGDTMLKARRKQLFNPHSEIVKDMKDFVSKLCIHAKREGVLEHVLLTATIEELGDIHPARKRKVSPWNIHVQNEHRAGKLAISKDNPLGKNIQAAQISYSKLTTPDQKSLEIQAKETEQPLKPIKAKRDEAITKRLNIIEDQIHHLSTHWVEVLFWAVDTDEKAKGRHQQTSRQVTSEGGRNYTDILDILKFGYESFQALYLYNKKQTDLLKGPWGSAVKQAKDISQSQQDEEQQLKIPRTPRDIAQKGINQWILRLFNEVLRDRGQNELSQLPKATL